MEIVSSTLVNRTLDDRTRQIADRNVGLLNWAVYSDKDKLYKIVQGMESWKILSHSGNQVASCIVVDIETAIEFADFSAKQKKILNMWMEGYEQTEIAEEVYSLQWEVSRTINRCVGRLQDILLTQNPYIE